VVIDTPHERAWREALADRHGADLTPAQYRDLVAGKPRLAGARAALAAHRLPEADAEAYAAAKQARFRQLVEAGEFTIHPDAVRFLEHARTAGQRIAAASSSKNASAILARAGLAPLFHTDLSGRDVPHGKPAPDLFLLAAAALATPPEACLVLEDAPAGIQAARAAGMQALGIARAGEDATLAEAGATLVVATLDDPRAHALLGPDEPHARETRA
jgi:HAD superfamily hydrolase (TIGR01509 family)